MQNRESIFAFTANSWIPVISGSPIFADSGALCTYGPDLVVSYRRLAYYVDRVLTGAKPADTNPPTLSTTSQTASFTFSSTDPVGCTQRLRTPAEVPSHTVISSCEAKP